MNRLGLILPFLRILLTRPSIILKSLYHIVINTNRKDHVIGKYNMPNGLPQLDILDLLPGLNETIDNYTNLAGTSFPIDMVILKQLAKKYTDCDYFEIGTWRGESISNVASVAKKCVSLSLSNKEMNELGYGEKFTRVQRFFSKDLSNVEHVEANSKTFDFEKLGQKFDLIFVDGDHSYDGVKIDTQNVFNLLKNENSIIVWHDYGTSYETIDWEVLAGILDGTPEEKRGSLYQISNSLCAIYIKGDFKTKVLDYPTYPDKKFKISISAQKI
ncbi:MAG: class I SAM-dependent methyltransferase [Bacteroidetes bacterium]|nr:class I SAM-dependent methyltransferase [Bacteroidota bacterium]